MNELAPTPAATTAIESVTAAQAAAFELLQREAKMYSSSSLVPKEFQQNMANCAIALNIARQIGANPFMVMQNLDVIHGRPAFRSTFLLGMVNSCKRFSPVQFRVVKGEKKKITIEYSKWSNNQKVPVKFQHEYVDMECTAYATTLATGEVVEGPTVTMDMAIREGWMNKDGSKWLTMPEVMIRYRAAAFFARIYASDVTLGMATTDELDDMPPARDVTPPTPPAPKLFNKPDAPAPTRFPGINPENPAPVVEADMFAGEVPAVPLLEQVRSWLTEEDFASIRQEFLDSGLLDDARASIGDCTDSELARINSSKNAILARLGKGGGK